MKLRIHLNSIRIRLTQTEVAAIAAGKPINQSTSFSTTAKLILSITPSSNATAPSVVFHSSNLTIILPRELARRWAESDEVSIQAEQPVGDDEILSLLIEKDFECLHHREENTDAFPKPRAQEAK